MHRLAEGKAGDDGVRAMEMQALLHKRLHLGYTQARLAAAAGISVEHLSRLENGHRDLSPGARAKLLDAVGWTEDHLDAAVADARRRAERIAMQAEPGLAKGDEPVGGAVPLGSPAYVERQEDRLAAASIVRRDGILLIKGPRQTGKSSMLARALHRARTAGQAVAVVDLEGITASRRQEMDGLCRALAESLAGQFGLAPAETDWQTSMSPALNMEHFMLDRVLTTDTRHVVIGIDEVDRLFGQASANEFFAMLRSWHERRSLEPHLAWGRLTVVLACATEAQLYITNLNQSPFNAGTRLTLRDFSRDEVGRLNALLGAPLRGPADLDRFTGIVGGHPFLVRLGLRLLATDGRTLDQLEAEAEHDGGPFAEHLSHVSDPILTDATLRSAVVDALARRPCARDAFLRLRSAGVLIGDCREEARPRCGLYARRLARLLV
ncbi:MAG: AAA-like domain-containing protein [Armatimonadetes bacterium]|nr:AAA-like domain-containing protein [Armatimonadota bacterium]